MPMREFPWAPAQGAIAIEIASSRPDLDRLIDPIVCAATTAAVNAERQVLEEHGGGCHQALGAAIIEKPYGRVVSVRSRDTATSRSGSCSARARHFPASRQDESGRSPARTIAAERAHR